MPVAARHVSLSDIDDPRRTYWRSLGAELTGEGGEEPLFLLGGLVRHSGDPSVEPTFANTQRYTSAFEVEGRFDSYSIILATLAPETLQLKHPISAVLQWNGDECTATFCEANIGAAGETEYDAILNLKELIAMTHRSLANEDESKLSRAARIQRSILASIVSEH